MIVAIWTLSASVGAAFAVWNAADAFLDWLALPPGNGSRLVARGEIRREAIRFFVQASWALIGVVAWVNGASSNEVNPLTFLLIGTNVAVATNTILDARDRHRLHRILGISREID